VAAIESGAALEKLRVWVAAQGGDPRVADDLSLLPQALCTRRVIAHERCWIAHFDAAAVGHAAMAMGAGRAHIDDVIDPAAGLVLSAKVGDLVKDGDTLAVLHAASEDLLDAGEERFRNALVMSERPVSPRELVIEQ
jgi:thymidine phosphorylase